MVFVQSMVCVVYIFYPNYVVRQFICLGENYKSSQSYFIFLPTLIFSTITHTGGEVPKKFIHKKCSVEGCTNFRQKGAVCTRHGGRGRKNCRVEGCTKLAVLHGICVAHGTFIYVA